MIKDYGEKVDMIYKFRLMDVDKTRLGDEYIIKVYDIQNENMYSITLYTKHFPAFLYELIANNCIALIYVNELRRLTK